ncbi:MAG: transcriptional regulator NrdR [Eubacteriales bacterium]|nr:transcriptional regulator NrdR [Eubacteriales bacterium]
MKCIFCNSTDSKVVDSRPTEDGCSIRRRRECVVCGKRFTTYEKVESPMVLVVKKDGRREAFNVNKIRHSLVKACEKRTVGMDQIDAVTDRIERRVYNTLDQEISSRELGEMVMDELKSLDQVAYVRFASVYRQFKDINTFRDELNKLLHD